MPATRLKRAQRSAVTRRKLLRSAETCFLCNGYRTTLEEIADEADYTQGAVYSTFQSKSMSSSRSSTRSSKSGSPSCRSSLPGADASDE